MVVVLEKSNKFSESYSCPLSARNNYYRVHDTETLPYVQKI